MDEVVLGRVSRLAVAAASRLADAGLSDDEVLAVLERRLAPGRVAAPVEAGSGAGGPLLLPSAAADPMAADAERRMLDRGEWPPRLAGNPSEAGRPRGAPLLDSPEWEQRLLLQKDSAGGTGIPGSSPANAAGRADEPGEPPVGTVVTDTRSRVCWRDEAGWHRAGTDAVLTWTDVCQAVGAPPQPGQPGVPLPGQPTIVSQPERRAQGPMTVRSAGRLDLPVQRPVLGEDGQPVIGPNGQPLLKTETESVEISEVVPAGGRP